VAQSSSQKFIGRNRCPRVQIEYDVELYGAEKKIQLPFVMGVLADLSGKPAEPLPPVADRKFLEIDVDNFDDRMSAIRPRVAFQVPNTLTGDGNLSVELTFEKMDDFSPAAVARSVDALRRLLEARQQLANLITYMDGKTGAEELVGKLLQDPTLLQALATTPKASAPAPEQHAENSDV
jgi:type VI secretion system protein ImpB